ncbi:hypothetical protein K443DRAFT_121628 [Laccaria amethystina LaAM-08-1]|uniref:Unplaced genomic scaffold K443scaffold_49, whole genome shotgun sequence n=1 Tax=Laccaria amethystina LaAM-08-1 TaxID=1095629 RepID=A0A0C9XNK0_9AGAR|nr:hypothetical protein K443DRAFT_121628 [Laccaria amethystina LaAM-08-1]
MAELNLATGGYLLVVVMGEHQFIRTQERSGSASVGCEGPQYQDRCAHAVISCRLLIEERDTEIPQHIDIYIIRGEAEPSDVNAVDFIVASAHAKDFMHSVCTNIMDYYSTCVKTKHDNEVNQMKAYYKQQEEFPHIKKFIASAGNLVHQANSKQRIIDKMEAACFIEKIEYQKPLRFNFEDIRKLPPPIIAFDNMRFRIRGIRILYEKLSFGIHYSRRQRKLARYSQHSADELPYDSCPIEYFQQLFSQKFLEKDIMAWKAQSGAHQTALTRQLSDGLRNRVVFAQLAMEHPHILLLDEPTDNLDMQSIDALAKAIKEFAGGIVIVSHDFRIYQPPIAFALDLFLAITVLCPHVHLLASFPPYLTGMRHRLGTRLLAILSHHTPMLLCCWCRSDVPYFRPTFGRPSAPIYHATAFSTGFPPQLLNGKSVRRFSFVPWSFEEAGIRTAHLFQLTILTSREQNSLSGASCYRGSKLMQAFGCAQGSRSAPVDRIIITCNRLTENRESLARRFPFDIWVNPNV